jgi:hypothetical protein
MPGSFSSRNSGLGSGISKVVQGLAIASVAVGFVAAAEFGSAEPLELAGAWSGGGSVSYPSGSREKARCRATFSKTSESSYKVSATCATPSGKVDQQASVKRVGANVFAGSFRNADYNMEGTIHISVQGNSQNITLSSSTATASLRLRR